MARSRRRAWFVAAIWLGISSSIVAQERDREAEFRGSRQMIWQMVLRAVQGIAEDAPEWAGDAAGDWGKVVSFAAGETLEGELLPVYQYVGETARTDKQLGSTSTSRGTTSLLEKPGLPTLLAFAIERGAIQQEQSGSDITLRSSPAALVKPFYHPPPGGRFEDSRSYSWLSRVGGSATTPVEDTESTTNGEVDLEEITEWSVQLNLNFWRDHTVYSREFVEKWRQDVVPAIERRLLAANKSIREVVDEAGFGTPEDRAAVIAALRSAVDVRVTDTGHLTGVDAAYLKELYEGIAGAAGPEDAIDRLSRDSVARKMYEAVDSEIERRVREPIRNGRSVPESTRTSLHDLRSTLTSSHASMTQIKKDLEEKLQDVMRVPILTAEYTNHKALQGSSVSDAKLLFQYKVDPRAFGLPEPFDIITNGNVSFYNDPDRSMGQHTLRDYGIGVGAEFSFDNPFAKFLSDADASNIGLSFSGRVARLESAEDEVGFAQAKLEIPITAAFRIPLSVTYASRTEEIDESEVRGNIGFTVDFDQLYALAGLALAQRH